MEKQCNYCQQPLAEAEQVRFYSAYVHSQCYDALLADAAASIVIEQPTHDHSNERMAELVGAVTAQKS